jgi:hypothetical protein
MLETVWSKQRIFEVYLNVIEWGNGVFGAEAAARHYYGVSAAQLSPEQAARLAGMVPSPRFYDRNRNAPGLARKPRSSSPACGLPISLTPQPEVPTACGDKRHGIGKPEILSIFPQRPSGLFPNTPQGVIP